MDKDIKVAVVTGASRGIGAALVAAYRERGYGVVATARSMKPAEDSGILSVSGDIADRGTAERVISEGMARFGRIDTLVNNAGIFVSKPFTSYTVADFEAVLAVNTIASSTSRSSPSPRWRSAGAAMWCRSPPRWPSMRARRCRRSWRR